MTPFLSFYTPTHRRPKALAACMASVAAQTAVDDIEQVIVADHVGTGMAGMFERIADYADALHGRYIHVLSDDEILASPTVVADVRHFIRENGYPTCVAVRVQYEEFGILPPPNFDGRPRLAQIGLSCLITRGDFWRWMVAQGGYGRRYEGDYDFAQMAWEHGHPWVACPVIFTETGRSGQGKPEAA